VSDSDPPIPRSRPGTHNTRVPLLVATRNAGKVRELIPMCEVAGFAPRSLEDAAIAEHAAEEDVIEAFATFEENALAKAHYFFRKSGGVPVLADDSGLAVDALHGAPGVRSKRWAGVTAGGRASDDANNALLVRSLAEATNRAARFVCAAALVWDDDGHTRECVALGEARGRILDSPRGAHGFGYDPYFFSDELAMTFAEADRAAKSQVSHRARAVHALFLSYASRT